MSDLRTRQAKLIEPATVLLQVLVAYPALITEADALREIAGADPPTPLERRRVKTGTRKLLANGVIRREGDSLVPTPATLFLEENLL